MKKTTLVFLVLLYVLNIHAQDTITLKNKKVIHAFIIEKNKEEIKYKLDTISAYTIFIKNLSDIRSIHFADGQLYEASLPLFKTNKEHKKTATIVPCAKYGLGINGSIGMFDSGGFFTCGIEYFVTPKLITELNIGSNIGSYMGLYYSLGGKYNFVNKYPTGGYSPFVGLLYGGMKFGHFLEAPVGFSYISASGFHTSIQLSYMYFTQLAPNMINFQNSHLKIELKAGWLFK